MPSRPSWRALDAALDRALALDGAERDAYVGSLDAPTRDALRPLLRDALADHSLLDHAGQVLQELAAPSDEEGPSVVEGGRVGPYRLEGLVGEGGMGRVYRARRADGAFDQTVAVKVVRQSLALAGADVASRLRRERALLAALDHPGIARLVDGGETGDGVPYLVTEFVDGAPITGYADGAGLGVRERVGLLARVARAVDHAHRRFVVHRDLKPSNVLVTERDGAARPVVLDFGIAKLLEAAGDGDGAGGSAAFPLTRTGVRLLTPAYAAPELYEPAATVTTAADVYGLGALLYELLTGRRPHGDGPSRSGPPTAEPTRPSRAVAGPGGGPGAGRSSGPGRARRSRALEGDLDTICLKALHPDPSRRYASAAALADDLERHLSGRPVEARPDSVGYVVGRFVRRNRAAVAAAAVAVGALVGGLGTALTSLAGEREARAEAEAAAARATEAAGLLSGLFQAANPERHGGQVVSARAALDAGLARVDGVGSDPLRGFLLGVLAETYAGAGDLLVSDSLYGRALAIVEADPEADPETVDRIRLGYADTRSRLHDSDRALDLFWKVARARGTDDSLGVVAHGQLLLELPAEGWAAEAQALVRGLDRAAESSDDPALRASALAWLTLYHVWGLEDFATGAEVAGRALHLLVPLYGPDHRVTRFTTAARARALSGTGRHDEAVALYRAANAATVRMLGPDSRDEAYGRVTLGDALLEAGRLREAEAELAAGIEMAGRHLPPDNQDIGWWLQTLAEVRCRLGRHREAEAAARRSLAIAKGPARGEGTSGPRALAARALAARALARLGLALLGQGRDAEGRAVLVRAIPLLEAPTGMPASYDDHAARTLAEVRAALAASPAPALAAGNVGG